MKKYSRLLTLIFSSTILVGCTTSVNINDQIDKNAPLKLTVTQIDSVTKLTTSMSVVIPVNSEKFKKITQWSNENTDGWHTTFASYNAPISITQNNFRLLRLHNGVVIGFTDKGGAPKQYSKTIKEDQLKFLSD